MKEYICYFPVWTGGLTPSFPLKFGKTQYQVSLPKNSTQLIWNSLG